MKKLLRSIRGSSSGSSGEDDKDKKDKSRQDKNSKQLVNIKDGPNPLCRAAFEGDIDKASEAIKVCGVNSLDTQLQKTPLHFAAFGGHLQMIKFLIDEGADPTIRCSAGRTPLYSAIEGSHEACAHFLIQKGYFTDKQDIKGSTVLHFAAFYGVPQCFRKMYTLSPALMGVYDESGLLPIHVAVKANREDIVNYICSVHTESCEAKTKGHEHTPLMLAVEQESVPLATILLEAGCRTDAKDIYGSTVELLAKSRRNVEICRLINQWSSQNNYESDKMFQNNSEKTPTVPIDSNKSPFNSRKPDLHLATPKAFMYDQSESNEKNKSVDKKVAAVVIHKENKVPSDEDSEWESSEAEIASRKESPKKLKDELTKRISQAFFTPVDGSVNLFQTPNNKSKTQSVITTVFNKGDKESHEEGTLDSSIGTIKGHKTLKSDPEMVGRDSNMVIIEDESQNMSVPEPENKSSDRILDPSDEGLLGVKIEIPARESTSNTEDKLSLKPSTDHLKTNVESDVSEWSKETENFEKSSKSAILDVDVDNILSLIDKETLPVFKDKRVKPDDNTDSDNDSSWDSDAEAMISNSEKLLKNKSDLDQLEVKSLEKKLSNVETKEKFHPITIPNVVATIAKNPFIVNQEDDDDDNVLNPEVTKKWVGVMNELTQRVGNSKLQTEGIPDIKEDEVKNNEIPGSGESWSSEDVHPSLEKIESTEIEHKNIPAAATLSSQTCRQTSSDIFGDLQPSPQDLEPPEDANNKELVTVIHKREGKPEFSSTSSTVNLLDNIDLETNDLNSPRNSSPFNTAAGDLVTRRTSLGSNDLSFSSTKNSPRKATVLTASAMVPILIEKSKLREDKIIHKPLMPSKSSSSLQLSSLLNDDVETLRNKLSKKSKHNLKNKELRKLSCPETAVAPSLLSKLKHQFSRKKSPFARSKSESLPDFNDKDIKDAEIEENEKILLELLDRAKEILLFTETTAGGEPHAEENETTKIISNQDDAKSTDSAESANARNRLKPDARGETYQSYKASSIRSSATPYCDSVNRNEPNPTVLKQVVNELSCIIDKTYGNYSMVQGRTGELEAELERLRKELKCCETCKTELESEMMKLQADFEQTRYALDEDLQAREGLEIIVADLRDQMRRLDELLECESREKNRLLCQLKEIEMRCKDGEDLKKNLELERDQLLNNCRQFEDLQNASNGINNSKIAELQEALIRCCQQNEAYEEEMNCLKKEIFNSNNGIDNLQMQLENMQFDTDRLSKEFECERAGLANEKMSMENCIAELKRRLECCERQKNDICEKMNLIVSEHHAEMDKLIEDATKYKNMYECLNDEFDLLRKKLEDCEEQKRKNSQNQHSNMQEQRQPNSYNNYQHSSRFTGQYSNEDPQQMKNNLDNANNKIAGLEKDLEKSKVQCDETTVVNNQLQLELQSAKESQKTAEKDLEQTKLKYEETTTAYNQLQSELQTAKASQAIIEKELETFRTLHNEKTGQLQTKLQEAEASQKVVEKELELSKINHDTNYNQLLSEIHTTKEFKTTAENNLEITKADYKKSQNQIVALQAELNKANLALKKQIEAQEFDNMNRNNESDLVQVLKQEYEDTIQKMNNEVIALNQLFEKAQIKVSESNVAQKQAEEKCENLLQSIKKLESQLDNLHPVSTEAEFYKTEATRMQKELIEREMKVAELTRNLTKAEESFQKNKESTMKENEICELRENIREMEIEKLRLQGLIKSLEERLQFVQPRLDAVFGERKLLEEKIMVLTEDNRKFSRAIEEDRASRELFQGQLKETKRLWENEIKAKGVLAEKIAKYERMNTQQDSADVEKWKDKFRVIKTELKSERDLTTRLKYKFDQSREQCRRYKEQLEEMINDPTSRKLEINIEEQKLKYEEIIAKLQHDREHLVNEIFRLGQSNTALQKEVKKLAEEIQLYEAEKTTLANIVKSKDRLEVELKNLKRAIKDQYVDKTELQRLKASYHTQIAEAKSQYELQMHSGINKKYSEITQLLDQQTRDRTLIDQIRVSNENLLRNELSTVKKSSDIELENLKRLVREQEEQIKSERSSRRLITERFSTEKKKNEELLRKMQLLKTGRTESLHSINNNNIIVQDEE